MTKLRGIIRTEPGKHRLHFHLFQICIYLDAISAALSIEQKIPRPDCWFLESELFGVKITLPAAQRDGAVAHAINEKIPVAIEMQIADNDSDEYRAKMAAAGLKKR